jgi:sugar O-acyltransferase (sialic acid O-acetyltransferase NeuD family)
MSTDPSSPANTLLLFGAGGHGRVVADACLRQAGPPRLVASDRDGSLCEGNLLPGVPLIRLEALGDGISSVHVAIGHNPSREKESHALGTERLVSVLHPHASVSDQANIGAGSFVAAQAVVAPGASLGRGVIVNHAAVVDHDAVVGEFSHIAPGAVLGGGVCIGARVLVGAGAVVLPGMSVCADALLGAGAVVCAPIEFPGVYVGVPARRVE